MSLDDKRLNTLARIRRFYVSEARRDLEAQLAAEAQSNLRLQQLAEQTRQEFELTRITPTDDPAQQVFPAWVRQAGKKFEEARSLCITAAERTAVARQKVAHTNGELNAVEELKRSTLAVARFQEEKKALAALMDIVSLGSGKAK